MVVFVSTLDGDEALKSFVSRSVTLRHSAFTARFSLGLAKAKL
jgi:hypothetical protein